jgi:hypothetical protein
MEGIILCNFEVFLCNSDVRIIKANYILKINFQLNLKISNDYFYKTFLRHILKFELKHEFHNAYDLKNFFLLN